MPVKTMTMRLVPISVEGFASQKERVWADSETSLWAMA